MGHKNSKVKKPPLRVNNENIRGNRGYSGKVRVKMFCIVFVNTFYYFFLANFENIRWNRIIAEIFVFQ